MTRVLLIDDHSVFADALALAVDRDPELTCVGTAESIEEALKTLEAEAVDVVSVDLHLPGIDGIEGTLRIKAAFPKAHILMLTGDTHPGFMAQAAAAGAAGFLLKTSPMSDVLRAIRTVGTGAMLIDQRSLASILEHANSMQSPKPAAAQLTDREFEVLSLMSNGLDAQGIADRLTISVHTCRGHQKRILAKLGAHSQLEAVVKAVRAGIIPGVA